MKLLRSFSFRLAAIYALLFIVSLGLLLGTFQLFSITFPREAVKKELRAESNGLVAAYDGDIAALAAHLEQRAGSPAPRAGFHLLVNPSGRVVSTNLPSWPRFAGLTWLSIEADIYRDGDEDDHEALAFDRKLADGSRLLIGRDVEELDDLEEAITSAALYLIAATIILATIGALLMNWAIGRRIDAVSQAARHVMGGDLSQRVEISGSGDDFDQLAATLNLMLERVEAGVEAIRIVSDNVAHELRTPLTRLQASLRAAETTIGERSPALTDALDEADRLQIIFDSVLRIARIESGRHEAQFERVDLSLSLADAAELYSPVAEVKQIRLSCDIPPGLAVTGDRDLIFQTVTNLLDNAIKFAPEGGAVRLRAKQCTEGVSIEISDNGGGMSDDLKARAGERFLRDAPTAAVPGFGLGLSLVEAVARLHGSYVTYANGNPGLVVRWVLPN